MQIQSWKRLNEFRSELYQALETLANFYPNIHCVLKVLYLSTKRLTGLALMNIHTDLEIDSEEVLKQFDATGRRAMSLGCNPLFARVCVCECAYVSLAFYLSPLNNVTYKHIGLAETNKQTNKQPKRQHAFLDRRTDAIHAQSTVVVIGSGEEVKRKGLYHH